MTSLVGWFFTILFVVLAFIRLAVIVCYFVLLVGIAALTVIRAILLLISKLKPRFGSRVAEKKQIATSTPIEGVSARQSSH